MASKFARLRALSWAEQRVLVEAMLLLPLFWIGLRVLGLSRFLAWLTRSPIVVRASRSGEDLAALGALVNIAGNHVPFPSTCLTRSLLLNWLLRCRGVESELRIGVRLNDGKFDAHAWVEHEGKPLNDAKDIAARFAAFKEPLSDRLFS
jgi:hypothetical protein